jgi:hypothetical protein
MGNQWVNGITINQGTETIISLGYILRHYQTKTLSDSDPDLTSSSLVTFGPNFDCILLHTQNFT